MAKQALVIGIDVGGTFTDAIALDPDAGRILAAFKLPSTPSDPAEAVVSALRRIAETFDIAGATVCHGTTVGTNTLIQRKGANVALVTTEGFTDVLELRRQNRPTLYDLATAVSQPLVPPSRRLGAAERMDAQGEPVKPLADLAKLVGAIRESGADAVAISCLHAYANSAHEQAIAQAVQQALPDAFVTASHDVCPEFREYERTSTTVVNAYIGPAVGHYIRRLAQAAASMGIKDLMIVKSNGGLTSPDNAQRYPVHLIESGPAAGMIATTAYARATERGNVIAFDMGGTTAKAGVVQDYQPKITDEFHADHLVNGKEVGGYPIRSAVLDIIEVGAGGGSIAWIDNGGVPKVGPESAGADPGPACYSRGGQHPTVTDAHAVIGTLNAETFDGTGVTFSRDLAVAAVKTHIADPMGWSVARAAHAIIAIAVANMTEMVRLATVRRGLDPREFSIVASGGAGPLHAADVGAEVGVKEVIVPPYPGIFSALGAMLGEIRHDLSSTLLRSLAGLSIDEMSTAFHALAEKAARLLERESGGVGSTSLTRYADLRFAGQLSELRVPLGAYGEPLPGLADIEARFRQAYQGEFGFDLVDSSVEMVNIHLVAERLIKADAASAFHGQGLLAGPAQAYQSRRYLDVEGRERMIPVYRSADCPGASLQGPLIIDHAGSTVWVPAGQTASVGADGGVVFRLTEA
ncbi:hydantoinase/oxoprolinase family protein [Bordetella sp. BOR01]|uniref:hydantoinase/oxoprolinase family protein n=1 Tax=Bordetella sp. BOR01 TaxID=2854779 RepID=UPI001C44045B|nr:hydantoinase/oxoprolinase family protein [Bordetella sp. BOR01]MBV7484617.1 hydantoinase/oxoprolinase family protein [Bordetella sp. BOR01]